MQYLIDASVYIFRAYYSMPDDMVDGDGNPVNALYGFCRFLGDFMEQVTPEYIAVAFDESLTTSYRTDIYAEYKANREPAPDDLKRQFELCRRYARSLGLMHVSHPRYEADDMIGTLVEHGRRHGRPSTVVTRDKDLAQLLTRDDIFWDFAGKGKIEYEQVPEVFGVWPEQIADFLALAGDSVDNIPGVRGVGAKTAAALLNHFDSMDDIYARLDEVAGVPVRGAGTLAKKLAVSREVALMSRRLTKIECAVPLAIDKDSEREHLKRTLPDLELLNALYDQADFGQILRRQAERIAAHT